MTKSEFSEWRKQAITEIVFAEIRERVAGLKDEVVQNAAIGEFNLASAKAGAVIALEDILDVTFEETQ